MAVVEPNYLSSFRRKPEPSPVVRSSHWFGLDSGLRRNDKNVESNVYKTLVLERLSGRNALETRMDIGNRVKYAGGHRP
jgi:hypothetical protein